VASKKRSRTAPQRSNPQRTTYHHGDLRNALVQAAIDVISTGGPELITLREVSRRVGVNHRAAYRHFEDLTSLLAAVAEQGYHELHLALQASLTPLKRATAERRLEAIGVAYIDFALTHPSHYRIMFGRRLNEDGRFPHLEDAVMQAFDLLQAEFTRGQESGRFAPTPVREAVFSFWSLAHGFASLALVQRIRVKPALLTAYSKKLLAPFFAGASAR
jgi:AcrR family transcriptional regulator